MLVNLIDITKTIGTKELYRGLNLTIQPGEKIGLIGRNGIGKTTLLGIMTGADTDFSGQVDKRRGLVIASTVQEHHGLGDQIVLQYVLENLPEYAALKTVIDTYPDKMGDDMSLIGQYTDALTRFGELGYYDIESAARAELAAYQLPPERIDGPMSALSGGQKRFVELTKVTLSDADLALVDEPTNHMDYVAKAEFIKWLDAARQAVLVITHDRDVLAHVDRIVEMKNFGVINFPGNYEAYLKQNGAATAQQIDIYENGQKRLAKIEKQIREARSRKTGWSGTADKTNPFMLLERRLTKERDELLATLRKPDFWIDQQTVGEMQDKAAAKYEKYKSRNIRLRTDGKHRERQLVDIKNLALGYGAANEQATAGVVASSASERSEVKREVMTPAAPLFEGLTFDLAVGERLRIHDRNGAGKSTLIRAILAAADTAAAELALQNGLRPPKPAASAHQAARFAGSITIDPKAVIGIYEQEIAAKYLPLPLGAAIRAVYDDAGIAITDQQVKSIMAEYLFDPMADGRLEIRKLSGGQKARFQLINMLAAKPNILILDEPTNHLDLPSIEELEHALDRYSGAILYISHDSYFSDAIGGDTLAIGAV